MSDMGRSETVVITRADLGRFASFIGGFMLLMGLLAYVWEGGAADYVLLLLGIGVAGMVAWVLLAPRDVIDLVTGRQAQRSTIAVFSTLLFIGIAAMFYTFVEREVITYDLTETGSFTLDAATYDVLDRVNRPMQITGFYSPENIASRELDDQYWRQYEVASDGLIRRQYIDPVEDRNVAEAFGAEDGDVFISFVDESGDVLPDSVMYVPRVSLHERDMTYAISRLLLRGNFIAYYAIGHGEATPANIDQADGLNISAQLLLYNGWDAQLIDLRDLAENNQPIPDDASVVIIAGPQEAYEAPVISLLDRYLDSGGSLLILADTGDFLRAESAFNDYLWTNWGLRMLDAVVVDARSETDPLDAFSAGVIPQTSITTNLNVDGDPDSAARFPRARPIEVDETPPVANGGLVLSSDASYAETNLDDLGFNDRYQFDADSDLTGPHVLVAYAYAEDAGRIVLIGDSDFLTDGYISSPQGNAELFLGSLNFLTQFDEQVSFGFEFTSTQIPTVFISEEQLDETNYLVFIFVPGLILFAGTVVWFRRSRR